METPATKRCVLSLKRQHMFDDEMEEDMVLLSSMAPPKSSQSGSSQRSRCSTQSSSESASNTSSSSGSSSTGSSRSASPSENQKMLVSASENQEIPVPGPSPIPKAVDTVVLKEALEEAADVNPSEKAFKTTALEEAAAGTGLRTRSPQPGPSRYEDVVDGSISQEAAEGMYEDIPFFQPLAVSTPREDVFMPNLHGEEIKTELRDGKMLIAQVEFDVIRDIRQTLKSKSQIHFSKLRERRSKVSKRMAELIKQRQTIDTLLKSLSGQRDEIDDAIHKFNYFVENFPI